MRVILPPPPYLRSQRLVATGSANLSACSGSPNAMSFAWTLFMLPADNQSDTAAAGGPAAREAPAQPVQVLQAQGPLLELAAGVLDAGASYSLLLTGFQPGQLPAQVAVAFGVAREAPVASIGGGGRAVWHAARAATFDASASYDPDACAYDSSGLQQVARCPAAAGPGLNFMWACYLAPGQPCLRRDQLTIISFPPQPTVSLDVESMGVAPGASFHMAVTVTSGAGRSSTTAVEATVQAAATLDVGVRLAHQCSSGVAFQAVAAFPGPSLTTYSYIWRVVRSSSGAAMSADDSATFLTGAGQPNLVLRLDTPWAAARLSAGAIFRILNPPRLAPRLPHQGPAGSTTPCRCHPRAASAASARRLAWRAPRHSFAPAPSGPPTRYRSPTPSRPGL